MAGLIQNNLFHRPSQQPNSLAAQYSLYNNAVNQNTDDYSKIMEGYEENLAGSKKKLAGGDAYTPTTHDYAPTAALTDAIKRIQGLATDGGYSDAGIADLRERGISPIRAIYANANRDIDRNRALSGGYSPNYNATKSKMARELSDKLAGQVTNVNADIAERVASNKLTATGQLAPLTAGESSESNKYGALKADTINDAAKFNLTNKNNASQESLAALNGMNSLYGTTPALTSTFGNQAMNAAQMQQQNTQQKRNNVFGLASGFMRPGGR